MGKKKKGELCCTRAHVNHALAAKNVRLVLIPISEGRKELGTRRAEGGGIIIIVVSFLGAMAHVERERERGRKRGRERGERTCGSFSFMLR